MEINQRIEKKCEEIYRKEMVDNDKENLKSRILKKWRNSFKWLLSIEQIKHYKIKRIKDNHDRLVEGEIIKLESQQELERNNQREIELREKH